MPKVKVEIPYVCNCAYGCPEAARGICHHGDSPHQFINGECTTGCGKPGQHCSPKK